MAQGLAPKLESVWAIFFVIARSPDETTKQSHNFGSQPEAALRIKSTRGFSLVEMLCSVIILGILVAVFYSVFLSNWKVMEEYSTRAALWQDMDVIIDQFTDNARQASSFEVSVDKKEARFFNRGVLALTYNLRANGSCDVTPTGGAATTLTDRVDFTRSTFDNTNEGRSLVINLALTDQVFERGVTIETSTEIYPRN